MLVFHPVLLSQTLSLAVIHPNQAHHNSSDVLGSCKNISVMSVFSHCAQSLLQYVTGVSFSVRGLTQPAT